MTFEPRTAIEFLSLQNNERTHAEFLAWLVSRHAGLGDQSVALLAHLLGPAWFSGETLRVKRVATETTVGEEGKKNARLDLLVELTDGQRDWAVLIEFKMKSVESPDQLDRYDAALARLLPGLPAERTRKVLLTVAGERPQSGDGRWLPRTYLALRHALAAITVPTRAKPHVDDYLLMLDRLCACLGAVDNPVVSLVLMSKPDKVSADEPVEALRLYVMDMKIRHLFVKAWWEEVARRVAASSPQGLPEMRWRVDAGGAVLSGEGLLNVFLAELEAPNGSRFVHGLQVQGCSLKAFIEPYPRRALSDEDVPYARQLHAALARVRDALPTRWRLGKAIPIQAGDQGHRSVTLLSLAVGGRRVDLDRLEEQRNLATWTDVVKTALAAVHTDIRPEAFPDFFGRNPAALPARTLGA